MLLDHTDWLVSTVPIHLTGLGHEDARTTFIQLARSAGFKGRTAAAAPSSDKAVVLRNAGVDLVLEPFQDAADQAADLLCGGEIRECTPFPGSRVRRGRGLESPAST